MPNFYAQGFSTPTSLYCPNAVEGMLADAPPHDFVTPSLVNAGSSTAQVNTITIGAAALNTPYSVRIQGVYIDIDVTAGITSDGDDTIADIATKLGAALIANGVIYGTFSVTTTATTVVLTSRKPGAAYSYTLTVSGGASSIATTTAAASPGILPFGLVIATGITNTARTGKLPIASTDAVRGISVRTNAHESQDGVDGVLPNEAINVLCNGRVWVKPTTAFKPTDTVYYSYNNDSTAGTVRNATGTGYAVLPGAKFENSGSVGDLAILKVNM
jgi:hypothetical protein